MAYNTIIMKHTIFIMFSAAMAATTAVAAFEENQTDARSFAMGGAWAALGGGSSPDPANPAALAGSDGWGASAGFALPFGMRDLAAVSSACRARQGRFGLGLGLNTTGTALYRESSLRASAAWRMHDRFSAGISAGGCHLAIQDYGSAVAAGLDLGIQGRPLPQLALGIAARNVNRPRMGDPRQELAQELAAGLAYSPEERATAAIHLQAQRDWPVQLRVGQEFRIWKGITVRAGYSNRPASVSGGFGLQLGGHSFGYAVRSHPELGLSHCLTLYFAAGGPAAGAPDPAEGEAPALRRIVLNAAPVSELMLLPGVARRQAEAIAACRDSLGGLTYLDELLSVKGITRRTLERMARFVDLGFDPGAPPGGFPVDINTASVGELSGLPGIGPRAAADIAAYRDENGPFKGVEELMNVRGIGRKTFERIRELVTVGAAEAE